MAFNCILFFRFDTANVVSADRRVVPITDVCLGFLGVQVYKMKQLLTPVLVSAEDCPFSVQTHLLELAMGVPICQLK